MNRLLDYLPQCALLSTTFQIPRMMLNMCPQHASVSGFLPVREGPVSKHSSEQDSDNSEDESQPHGQTGEATIANDESDTQQK